MLLRRIVQKRFASSQSERLMALERRFGANNYAPLEVVFDRAQGARVWDPEGVEYVDFLSAYSATNQGHCHPRLVEALRLQAGKLTLSSRAFFNSQFPLFAERICELLAYESVLPMNTGAEAVETALKLARRWAYDVKGVARDNALVLSAEGCFHGRTSFAISLSTDVEAREGFGPLVPGVERVRYGCIDSLEQKLREQGERVAAFIVEPIQGEAGVVVPPDGYLARAAELCARHNVLLVADEVQTGLCRTGRMLCSDHDGVRPDIVVLGKALSGGMMPVSAVLADRRIMDVIKPGQHGSTFGGNPLASAVAIEALNVLVDERLADAAEQLGSRFRARLSHDLPAYVRDVRGRGLLNAVDIDPRHEHSAHAICVELKNRGVLAKPTHNHIIRFAPPLVIEQEQLDHCTDNIANVLRQFK
jgi:ornithine--oxo-acid transaminase